MIVFVPSHLLYKLYVFLEIDKNWKRKKGCNCGSMSDFDSELDGADCQEYEDRNRKCRASSQERTSQYFFKILCGNLYIFKQTFLFVTILITEQPYDGAR
jgi:hypothetical protein